MSLRTTGLGKTIAEGGGHPPRLGLRAGPSELPQLPPRSNTVTTTSEMCGFSSFPWCSPGTAPHLQQASHLNVLFRESPRCSCAGQAAVEPGSSRLAQRGNPHPGSPGGPPLIPVIQTSPPSAHVQGGHRESWERNSVERQLLLKRRMEHQDGRKPRSRISHSSSFPLQVPDPIGGALGATYNS